LLDLSSAFNSLQTDSLLSGREGHDLSALEHRLQTPEGTSFDLRTLVMLTCAASEVAYECPDAVNDIPVRQTCRALHFLHAASWGVSKGTVVGEYVINYADGQRLSVPLTFGMNIDDLWARAGAAEDYSEPTKVVWRGVNPASKGLGYVLRLFDFRWQNPRPDVAITSIDFKSAMTERAPFLLAITAE
jgi:hypothetical protein